MNTKNMPLIIAFALPILFIITLALFVLIPRAQLNPEFDFVYTDSSEQYESRTEVRYRNSYAIENNKIIKNKLPEIDPLQVKDAYYLSQIEYKEAPALFVYSFETKQSREISFEDAQNLNISSGKLSPDGYSIEYNYGHSGVFELFGSDSISPYILKKGNATRIIQNLQTSQSSYRGDDLKIIGWAK